MDPITLRSGPLGVVLSPLTGGAIARFWSETTGPAMELLRPAPTWRSRGAIRGRWGASRWSHGRIGSATGRFAFGPRRSSLPPSHPQDRHAIHGHGFQTSWNVVSADPAGAVLEYLHAPGAWPWAYRAVQRISVTPTSLELELTLSNESDAAMPAGLGWHPYFPRTAATTLTARVTGLWQTDAEVLPVACVAPPPDRDPGRGLARGSGRARQRLRRLGRPGRRSRGPSGGVRLRLGTRGPLGTLVVYTPPGESFFCAEPVSHITDAFNLAATGRADTGMLTLAPGESVRASAHLDPGDHVRRHAMRATGEPRLLSPLGS